MKNNKKPDREPRPSKDCFVRSDAHAGQVPAAPRSRWFVIVAALLTLGMASSLPPAVAGPYPAEFDLADLFPDQGGDGSEGFVLKGLDDQDGAGGPVNAAGDINADGIDDFVTCAFAAGQTETGHCYVIFGRLSGFEPVINLSSLFPADGGDGSKGFAIIGVDPFGMLSSAHAAGDVNGDGIDDLILGALSANGAGEGYVLFGRSTGFPPRVELAGLFPANGGDGSKGFVLPGLVGGDFTGANVGGAADINGDGIDDIVISATNADIGTSNNGATYVVFGRRTGFAAYFSLASLFPGGGGDGSEGFVFIGPAFDSRVGRSVTFVGDINHDGIEDLLIGGSEIIVQRIDVAYLVFGRTTGFPPLFWLGSLYPAFGGDGSAGVVINGLAEGGGITLEAAGDVNGDGIDDFLVGEPQANVVGRPDAGAAFVLYGQDDRFPAVVELRDLLPDAGGDGSRGFVLGGVDADDRAGESVSGVGDVNSDGIDDFMIGARLADPGNAGSAYIVFGRDTGFPAWFDLGSLLPRNGGDGAAGFAVLAVNEGDTVGFSVTGAGDMNADGIVDFAVGAPAAGPGPLAYGEAYVLFGRSDMLLRSSSSADKQAK